MAARGVPWQSPDYEPLAILNAVLGGSFTSRLNLNLREHNTYGYQASSKLGVSRGVGLLEARGSVSTEHTADALQEMLAEIERLRNHPLDEQELSRVKATAIAQIPRMGLSLQATLEALSTLAMFDRPANEYPNLAAKLRQVSSLDVLRVARRYLAPENVRWFLVADASVVQRPLSQLRLGSLRIERARSGNR